MRQHRDLNLEPWKFAGAQRRKTRIAESGAPCAMDNTFAKRIVGFDYPYATAKLTVDFERHEQSLAKGKTSRLRQGKRERFAFERAYNSCPRQSQYGAAVF